jgi:hypothetical protein
MDKKDALRPAEAAASLDDDDGPESCGHDPRGVVRFLGCRLKNHETSTNQTNRRIRRQQQQQQR